MLLCGTLVSTIFHDFDDRLRTGQALVTTVRCVHYGDGVGVTTNIVCLLVVFFCTNGGTLIIGFWHLKHGD